MLTARKLILLLIAIMLSTKSNAQTISTIPTKQIQLSSAIAPVIINSPKSDSLRRKPFTYRDNRIPPPLWVVDGKIVTHEALSGIDPQHIENIVVVKGKEAITMFGASGINGALIITMKKR